MTLPALAFSLHTDRRHALHAVSGTAEVVLAMGASLAAGIAAAGLVAPDLQTALGLGTGETPDFLAASRALGIQMLVQYGVLFALAALFGLSRGRTSVQSHALGAPDRKAHPRPWLYGVVVGLVGGLIPTAVLILQDIAPIGQDTPFWSVMRDAELTWRFYLFMAIGSFVVIPVAEELGWRSYILGRLLEGYAPGAALILSTLGFCVLHVQYLVADPALLLTFAGLVLTSFGFGLCVLRTGSVWPAVLAHALINLPPPTELLILKFIAGAILLACLYRPIFKEVVILGRLVWRWSSLAAFAGLAGLVALAGLAVLVPQGSLIAGGIALGLAAGLGLLKRSAWRRV